MPFQSEAQRRYMWLKHPDIAQRWSDEMKKSGVSQKGLPYHKMKAIEKHHKIAHKLTARQRERSATIKHGGPGGHGRFPMPDRKHARLALQMLNRAKGLSSNDKSKIRARAHRILGN